MTGPAIPRLRVGLLALGAVLAAACAAPARIPVPAELPLRSYDQGYTMRWALERGPDRVRAVGVLRTTVPTNREVTLVLYGLDERGRIASQGLGVVRRLLDLTPEPFEVILRPTGRETRFELRIWQDLRPGLQGLSR